jgi:rhomboid protease GluP
VNDYPNSNPPQPVEDAHQGTPPQQPFHGAQGGPVRVALPQSVPYVTYTIIGVTVFIYILQLASQALFQVDLPFALFAKVNELIRAGQLWRLFTPALVHGSIPHVFFNMYALMAFGPSLERNFGRGRFITLYVLGAFAGNVLSFVMSDSISVGASTAIFGLIGAEGVFLYQNRKVFAGQFRNAIGNIVFITVINLAFGFSSNNIDNAGHIGGLIGGTMFAWFASPIWEIEGIPPMLRLVDKRPEREVYIGAALVILIFGALTVWGMGM